MSNKDSKDSGGWPEEVFKQMTEGHERFMRQFQQGLDQPQDASQPRSNNPFIQFRHFVDGSIGALADSFRNLPENMAELRSRMQEERERLKAQEQDIYRRWTGIEDATPDHVELLMERTSEKARRAALEDTLTLLHESRRRNANVPAEKIHALYHDPSPVTSQTGLFSTPMLSPSGACEYMPENAMGGYNQVATSNASMWRWPAKDYAWLSVEWFKRSPYSPISLERQIGIQAYGEEWRLAFEDLMSAALDKPMATDPYQQGSRVAEAEPLLTAFAPGVDWMLSLQCRGILPPQLPSLYNRRGPSVTTEISKDRVLSAFQRPLPATPEDDLHQDVFELCRAITTPQATDEAFESELDLFDSLSRPTAQISEVMSQANELQKLFEEVFKVERETHDPIRSSEKASAKIDKTPDTMTRIEQEKEALGLLHDDSENLPSTVEKTKRVDVLSSLTTTHSVRNPDGTITKKVVLKERFADGREEIREKTHTYQDTSSLNTPALETPGEAATKKKKSGGWFWTGRD